MSEFQGPSMSEPEWKDIRVDEQERIAAIKVELQRVHAAVRLADSLLQLAKMPAYQDFVETLGDLHRARFRSLLDSRSDREAAILTGACRELDLILGTMQQTADRRRMLAATAVRLQDELRSIEHPNPQETPA
jgi:hypothetical protein